MGIIQCSSFTTDGSGVATVTLGWELQFLMAKRSDSTGNWIMLDNMRGLAVGTGDMTLYANLSNAESGPSNEAEITATGFKWVAGPASATFVYMAIRRPNKPPTSGTQVFAVSTSGVSTDISVGFPVDMSIHPIRTGDASNGWYIYDRMRGGGAIGLQTAKTSADNVFSTLYVKYDKQNVFRQDAGNCDLNWFFRRAPGVFDICAYSGTGSATTVAHNLGVAPELMIVKSRSAANGWPVYVSAQGAGNFLYLDSTAGVAAATTVWNNTAPTSSVFSVGVANITNQSSQTFIAYLFATKAGISKVGSYTGNGSSQTIDCGFSTGARFVMIKAVNGTGDWFIFDTARGITAGGDPYLVLNRTAAENDGGASGDLLDPHSSGFIVNVDLNSNGTVYLFLAFS